MEWIDLLRDATERFAGELERGDLDAAVPTCPGWTLADLGEHLRRVHVWAGHAVTEGNPDGEPPPGPMDRESLLAGYRAAAEHLVVVLSATAADAPAWAFGPKPRVAGFWRRRQVHETTMHLYDALAASGRTSGWAISPELAWDGVDEVGSVFYPRQVRLGRTGPLAGTLRLVASDLPAASIDLGDGEPVVDVRGRAEDLLLTLWRRRAAPADAAVLLDPAAVTP